MSRQLQKHLAHPKPGSTCSVQKFLDQDPSAPSPFHGCLFPWYRRRRILLHLLRLPLPAFPLHHSACPPASFFHYLSILHRWRVHSVPIYLFYFYQVLPCFRDKAKFLQNRQSPLSILRV